MEGSVLDSAGRPAPGALVGVTNLASGAQVAVLETDAAGRFQGAFVAGDYALAVPSDREYAWIEKQNIPGAKAVEVRLSRDCHPLTGRVAHYRTGGLANLTRKSVFNGDSFMARPRSDGVFRLCLPDGHYRTAMMGTVLSIATDVALPETSTIEIAGFASDDIKVRPGVIEHVAAELDRLVLDIITSKPTIVGLGEASHGTAEFFSKRSTLTLELARRAGVRVVLLELDAIAGVALDDYVTGKDVDVAKAVADLKFWITDTKEFLSFLGALRQYNATVDDKVHVWGIDIQNTIAPSEVLLSRASSLAITEAAQADLRASVVERGKGYHRLPVAQQERLQKLFDRLSAVAHTTRDDLLVAVAARSLSIQLHYWDNESAGDYSLKRDIGLAEMARFVSGYFSPGTSCLWAHVAHVSKQRGDLRMGYFLAMQNRATPVRYYAVGFYMLQGSARAWDAEAKIGVISHVFPAAQPYSVESALMTAAGMPEVAWVPLRAAPPGLAR
jgi:erythromycin esterase